MLPNHHKNSLSCCALGGGIEKWVWPWGIFFCQFFKGRDCAAPFYRAEHNSSQKTSKEQEGGGKKLWLGHKKCLLLMLYGGVVWLNSTLLQCYICMGLLISPEGRFGSYPPLWWPFQRALFLTMVFLEFLGKIANQRSYNENIHLIVGQWTWNLLWKYFW